MTPSLYHDQTKTESRDMGMSSRGGGCSRSTPARDERQDRSALLGRAGFHGCCTSLLTGAGLHGSAHFSQFHVTLRHSPVERHRRQVGAVLLPRTRSVATKFLRDLNSGALAFHTIHNLARQSSYGSKSHSVCRLSCAGSDDKDRDTEGFANGRKEVVGERNV